ncbi:MAG TPA: crotonase/enoyl-CoA hydratase family protein [Acidimicrobiales bacterium]|nr:crotonase/enoyl-CoA hydratase family protein [Acidimicrobiales bacterium]
MSELVSYERDAEVATITMDDGKVNVFSVPMLRALHEAFDQAEGDGTVVILTGREGYFSAGFDLLTIAGGPEPLREMLTLGATLAQRLLAFPRPVVATCPGHAYPAGAFLLLSSDTRIGAAGAFRIGLNEVRIGLTLPWFAIELARHRLQPSYFDRGLVTATMYDPAEAVTAGFLDQVVAPGDLRAAGLEAAGLLAELDPTAHAATKRRVRRRVLDALQAAIDSELPPP